MPSKIRSVVSHMSHRNIFFYNSTDKVVFDAYRYVATEGGLYVYENVHTGDKKGFSHRLPLLQDPSFNIVYY